MATLTSVNVGLPKDIEWNDRTVYSGLWKQPVEGPRMVRRLNIDGDGQGDLGGHGGENRAVLVYQLDSYRHWAREFHRDDLAPGYLGENLTVDGLPDDEVCIGDRYQIGQAVFEVTQPRVTCYRAGIRIGEPRMAALLVSHRAPGLLLQGHQRRGSRSRPGDRQDQLGSGTGHGRRDRRAALPAGASEGRARARTSHSGTQSRVEGLPAEPRRAGRQPRVFGQQRIEPGPSAAGVEGVPATTGYPDPRREQARPVRVLPCPRRCAVYRNGFLASPSRCACIRSREPHP